MKIKIALGSFAEVMKGLFYETFEKIELMSQISVMRRYPRIKTTKEVRIKDLSYRKAHMKSNLRQTFVAFNLKHSKSSYIPCNSVLNFTFWIHLVSM